MSDLEAWKSFKESSVLLALYSIRRDAGSPSLSLAFDAKREETALLKMTPLLVLNLGDIHGT